jgi:hypothetical protein
VFPYRAVLERHSFTCFLESVVAIATDMGSLSLAHETKL